MDLRHSGVPLLSNQDPLRLILHTGQAGITGLDADDWFLPRGLVGELPEPASLTLCLGLARHRGLGRQMRAPLAEPAAELPRSHSLASLRSPTASAGHHLSAATKPGVDSGASPGGLKDAEGCIAAELLCPYPPGIPLLIPGERLDRQRQCWLERQQLFWGDQIPDRLSVVSGG